MDGYYVSILTNSAGVLYIGVTSDMSKRLWEHVHDPVPGFSARYNLDRLIFSEIFPTPREAIAREKQLKGWRREKKTALIATQNPSWRDISGRKSRPMTALTCLILRQAQDDRFEEV